MKVSVCASLIYYYDVEVDEKLCELNKYGYLKREAQFIHKIANADPLQFSGVKDNVVADIISARNTETDKELYIGC